jgi:hypothetical protein
MLPLPWFVLSLSLSAQPPARRVVAPARQQQGLSTEKMSNAPVNPFLPTAAVRASAQVTDASFRAYPALNDEIKRMAVNAGRRHRLHLVDTAGANGDQVVDPTSELLSDGSLMSRFGLALAARKAVDRKEFFESCEFFARVRSKLKADDGVATLVDVAGGHGLVGALVAIHKYRDFERVIVRDRRKPKAFDAGVAAAVEVAPWVAGRIVYEQGDVGGKHHMPLPAGCSVVGVHGCNKLTDYIIEAAAEADARSLALMPCCYARTATEVPRGLRHALGVALAADVHRTYEMERLGWSVAWKAIPTSITPMNRILLAHRAAR